MAPSHVVSPLLILATHDCSPDLAQNRVTGKDFVFLAFVPITTLGWLVCIKGIIWHAVNDKRKVILIRFLVEEEQQQIVATKLDSITNF